MRLLVPLLVASAGTIGCVSADHQITGTYYLINRDGPVVTESDGSQDNEAVIDILAKNWLGDVHYDEGTFHSPTIDGAFALTVPDGVRDVHVLFVQRTATGLGSQVEYSIDGTIDTDVDMGTIELPP